MQRQLLICSLMLAGAPSLFALPAVWVNLDGQVYSGAYNNPQNNDNFQGGTNEEHFVSTGYLAQTSTSGGNTAAALWTLDDVVQSPLNDGTFIPVAWKGDCTSIMSGTARMGALHAYCHAVQEITPFSVSYAQTDGDGNSVERTSYNPLIATASAQMGVSAQDSVTVTGTLPPGTMVQVRLGLAVDCAVTPNSYPANAQVTAQTYCAIQNGFNSYDTDTLNFNSQTDGNSVNTNEVFNVPIGTTFYVIQSLSADASASSDLGNTGMYQPLSNKTPSSEASADAGNTAHFYLDVLTPGAALTTVSGHNYTMPPQLALLTTNAPGFTLAATCVPQQSWVLQYSTDMAHWSDVSTNQADITGQLQITLPAPNASSKYYRLRSP